MTSTQVLDLKGKKVSELTLKESVFAAEPNSGVVHAALVRQLANARTGSANTKTRGEVRGGGAKPWRQKGTGRARAGSSRSPIWTGGGTVFRPRPRHYTGKVSRKPRRAAFASALSVHAQRGSLAVFDAVKSFDAPSTADAAALLADWGPASPALVLLGPDESNAGLSFRNLPRITAMPVD